mgnify:CR=1 FL=1
MNERKRERERRERENGANRMVLYCYWLFGGSYDGARFDLGDVAA